jgi:hypothetical protein
MKKCLPPAIDLLIVLVTKEKKERHLIPLCSTQIISQTPTNVVNTFDTVHTTPTNVVNMFG